MRGYFEELVGLFIRLFGFGFCGWFFGFFSLFGWGFGGCCRSSWSGNGSDGVAFGSKTGIALDEQDDTFNQAPDTVSHHDEVGNSSKETKDGRNKADATIQSNSGDDRGKHNNNKATSEQNNVNETLLFVAEVPVVGAELTEEDTEQTGSNGGFDGGWFSFLHEKLLRIIDNLVLV